jgi:hypothetical protein
MRIVKQELSSREKRVKELKRITYLAKRRTTHGVELEAHNIVYWAKKYGIIKKASGCTECGSTETLDYHHDDYEFPLAVRALCRSCHRQWHNKNTALNTNLSLREEFFNVIPRFMFERLRGA